jgi:hypothetical protein
MTGWEEMFGLPAVMRHDPEGAMVSTVFLEEMLKRGVKLVATAGEAHWQAGVTERMIQTLMITEDRLHKEDRVGLKIAMSTAVKSQNSPMQWALGRNPTWADQLHDADEGDDHVNIAREGSE